MHISKVRELINKALKQYKHNAVPTIEHFECSTYNDDMEGLGVNFDPSMVMGLFVIVSENAQKYSFFWKQSGEITSLGITDSSVFDNIVCFAAMTSQGYIWLLDLLIWDSRDFRNENNDFRFKCLVRLTTNTQMPSTYSFHLPVQVKKIDKNMYPTVYEFYKNMTIFHKESFKF